MRRVLTIALLAAAALIALPSAPASAAPDLGARALRIADFLLAVQRPSGAIPDSPPSRRVNEDSNMEYALIGLAAAYESSGERRYLEGLERGIRWLAQREEMADPTWRGSWFYAYSAAAPFDPIPTSPGRGVSDVRGVDATSALFAYLVWLQRDLSGDPALAAELEPNVRAALDFVLARNRAPDGFFASSWQLRNGRWRLWRYRYAADQGDVHLGLHAGALLYGDPAYRAAAGHLSDHVGPAFFSPHMGRFALGTDPDGSRERSLEGFNGIFPQGYLAWVFGPSPQGRRALGWLRGQTRSDGSIVVGRHRSYALSAAIAAMGRRATGLGGARRSLRWLARVPFDPADGGVTDTGRGGPKYVNVAGFAVVSLLGFTPFGR